MRNLAYITLQIF